MLSSDKSNIFVSMKVHLASVYEKILSSMKVNLSSGEVNLSSGEVGSSGMKVNLSSMKVNLSSMKVNLSKILILKSIVCCVCVMFSSDVSWGMEENDEINDNDIVLKEIKLDQLPDETQTYKVVLLGDDMVGKTQISKVKMKKEFNEKYKATEVTEFCAVHYSCEIAKKCYSKTIWLQTWDTSGSEKYKNLMDSYLKDAYAIALVYDITKKKSFENIQKRYLDLTQKITRKDAAYFLVGNKIDLNNERQVTTEDAQNFAEGNNMIFFEVSAKNGTNIDKLFEAIAKACVKKDIKRPQHSKNKCCDCCPCCNKDEDDQKGEIKSLTATLNTLPISSSN